MKNIKLLNCITILLCLIGLNATAQKILMEQHLAKDTIPKQKGPNLKKFTHVYIFGGAILSDNKSLYWGASNEFGLGVRRKRKLNKVLSLGYDLSYFYRTNRIKSTTFYPIISTNANQSLETSTLRKEKLIQRVVELQPYLRLNYGKRGNKLGNYIDFGIYGEWGFLVTHVYKVNIPAEYNEGTRAKYIYKHLPWLEPINYGGLVRIGFNKFSFYGVYRYSNMFKSNKNSPFIEFPRMTVGIQYAVF